ncbi:hypothetical protein MYOV003v1_p0030 [Vibrio phage 207E48.1]|nr:hypothetical protein MYOV003v1_p0030 [Vibrio phage 207E48.1]
MFKFIKEMFTDLWGFGFWGKVSALLMATAMAGLAFFILILIDMCGYEHQERVAIVGTDYVPAHTTMVAVTSGNTTTLVPQYVPEAFYIQAQWNSGVYNCRTEQFYYTKVLEGSVERQALGNFTSGLITSNEYCDSVEVTLK